MDAPGSGDCAPGAAEAGEKHPAVRQVEHAPLPRGMVDSVKKAASCRPSPHVGEMIAIADYCRPLSVDDLRASVTSRAFLSTVTSRNGVNISSQDCSDQ